MSIFTILWAKAHFLCSLTPELKLGAIKSYVLFFSFFNLELKLGAIKSYVLFFSFFNLELKPGAIKS
jgi:hypothetical protein